jgi:hypothetical protein
MDNVLLSQIARSPVVAAFFARGERDNGGAFAVPSPRDPNLIGSAGASLRWRVQLEAARADA